MVVTVSGAPGLWLAFMVWLGFQPPPPPIPVSPHHLSATAPPRAPDACTWVAGVKHCPLPRLSEPR